MHPRTPPSADRCALRPIYFGLSATLIFCALAIRFAVEVRLDASIVEADRAYVQAMLERQVTEVFLRL